MQRINHTTTRMRDTESEYALIRKDTSDILLVNKHLKHDLSVIQGALKTELDINEENTLRIDTVKRNLLQASEGNSWEINNEHQLKQHLHERGAQILQKEDLLVELDRREREIIYKQENAALEIIRFRNGGGIVEHDVPNIQRSIDRLSDEKN